MNNRAEIHVIFSSLGDIDELWIEFNSLLFGLLPLDAHDTFDTFSDIEGFQDLPELICFDLSIIKKVLNHEAHDVGRRLLHFEPIMKVLQDTLALGVHCP